MVLGVISWLVIALAKEWAGADLLCVTALAILLTAGEVDRAYQKSLVDADGRPAKVVSKLPGVSEVAAGFGNTGLLTVGVLFVVVGLCHPVRRSDQSDGLWPGGGRSTTIFASASRSIC